MLKVGDQIPELNLLNQAGEVVTKKDLKGKFTVIYFYPKDNTPGCTTQACDFTNAIEFFNDIEVPVYGISPDSVASHQRFITKKDLKIILLADEGAKICQAFGVYGEKKNFGVTYQGVFRTTFIVDPKGKIVEVFEKVKAAGHVEIVKNRLQELTK